MRSWIFRPTRWVVDHVGCILLNHPPVTSIAWGGRVEGTARQTTMEMEAKGMAVTVNCVCGRRMVRPIWDEDAAVERFTNGFNIVVVVVITLLIWLARR